MSENFCVCKIVDCIKVIVVEMFEYKVKDFWFGFVIVIDVCVIGDL